MPDPHAPVVVFTDGACAGNPGPGGWAWAVSEDHFRSGYEPATTNQRMELTAVLEAVRAFPGAMLVVSDSTYVVNCFRQRWWAGWREKGWKNAGGKPVANQDLWRPLIAAVVDERPGAVRLEWVKGHGTSVGNILADRLATEASRLRHGRSAGAGAADPPSEGAAGPDRAGLAR